LSPGGEALASGFEPDGIYLDTATYGLPSEGTVAALETALERWRRGTATMEEYDAAVVTSRGLYADLAGTNPSRVAVANQVSVFAGLVAASIPSGSRVVVADDEFTSILFPLLVNESRGLRIDLVPFEDLAEAIEPATALVAFSAVRSNDGKLVDIDGIEERARRHGTRMLVDTTQAMGWLPIDSKRFDYTVASAYKWLLSPRGTAFMTVSEDAAETLQPLFAGWYAGEEVWDSIYGGPLRLASSARRFDVSPAWLSWMGTAPALELIVGVGVERIHRHDVALANQTRQLLGQEPSQSAILTIALSDTSVLAARGIEGSVRADAVRVGFHLYNDESDVTALVDAVKEA